MWEHKLFGHKIYFLNYTCLFFCLNFFQQCCQLKREALCLQVWFFFWMFAKILVVPLINLSSASIQLFMDCFTIEYVQWYKCYTGFQNSKIWNTVWIWASPGLLKCQEPPLIPILSLNKSSVYMIMRAMNRFPRIKIASFLQTLLICIQFALQMGVIVNYSKNEGGCLPAEKKTKLKPFSERLIVCFISMLFFKPLAAKFIFKEPASCALR